MEVQNKKVDASPTKSFFIYMLTTEIYTIISAEIVSSLMSA